MAVDKPVDKAALHASYASMAEIGDAMSVLLRKQVGRDGPVMTQRAERELRTARESLFAAQREIERALLPPVPSDPISQNDMLDVPRNRTGENQ